MEFRSFRETSVRDFSVIQIVLRGKGNTPQVRGWEILQGVFFTGWWEIIIYEYTRD